MTKIIESGVNPVITAYDRGNVFLRADKYVGKTLLKEVGKEYAIGTVLGVVLSTGKCTFLDVADNTGKEVPKFILAQDVVNDAVAATPGSFLSPDISGNLAAMLALTDAEFDIAVDGAAAESVTALNIAASGATTMSDLAQVLEVAIQADVTVVATATTIQILSNTTGTSSTIALSVTGGAGADLTSAAHLNLAAATEAAGVDATSTDADNVRVLAEGEVDASLLILPDAVTINTVVTGKGMVKDLLKSESILVVEGQENTYLDNGGSLA